MKDCTQCGKCCINYGNGGLSATRSEIDWWENYRPEIFAYVRDGKIWADPATGQRLPRCPWLEKLPGQDKYRCGIYHDRPEDCRHYPVTIAQMVADGCEMLEARDLIDRRRAQSRLDELMSDSRPPVQD